MPEMPDDVQISDDSAASLDQVVGQIVERIEYRMANEHPMTWNEWNSYTGRNVNKMEDPARWRRRVMTEVLKANLPNDQAQRRGHAADELRQTPTT